jgi:uncharacterized protein
MHTLSIIFCAACMIFYFLLSVNASLARKNSKIALGEKGNENLARAVRAHGNFAEYLESVQVSKNYLVWVGIFFLLGRISHAYSMFAKKGLFRVSGMILTFVPYLANIANLLIVYFK